MSADGAGVTMRAGPRGLGLRLPVPVLTAANVLVWVVVSLQLARSLV